MDGCPDLKAQRTTVNLSSVLKGDMSQMQAISLTTVHLFTPHLYEVDQGHVISRVDWLHVLLRSPSFPN